MSDLKEKIDSIIMDYGIRDLDYLLSEKPYKVINPEEQPIISAKYFKNKTYIFDGVIYRELIEKKALSDFFKRVVDKRPEEIILCNTEKEGKKQTYYYLIFEIPYVLIIEN